MKITKIRKEKGKTYSRKENQSKGLYKKTKFYEKKIFFKGR
jgi:hypothetical protein